MVYILLNYKRKERWVSMSEKFNIEISDDIIKNLKDLSRKKGIGIDTIISASIEYYNWLNTKNKETKKLNIF